MSKRGVSFDDSILEKIREAVRVWWSHNTRESLVKDHDYHPDEVDTLEEATLWIMTDEMDNWECSLEEMRDSWHWEPLQEFLN